jgi:hypothetical protein
MVGRLMNVEKLVEWELAEKLVEKQLLYHIVHHKSHMTGCGIETKNHLRSHAMWIWHKFANISEEHTAYFCGLGSSDKILLEGTILRY